MQGKNNPQYGKHSNGKQILCIETNIIYPSARAAAKAVNRSHTSIINACNKKGQNRSAGYH